MNRGKIIIPIILIAVLGLPLSKTLTHLLTEAWWFDAVGFSRVFWTRLTWQILIWLGTFVLYALFLWGNYRLALHLGSAGAQRLVLRSGSLRFLEGSGLEAHTKKLPNYVALVFIFLLALSAATESTLAWETILKYLNSSEFGIQDPIYQQDIGFYLFQLPLYEGLRNWLLGLLLCGLSLSILVYGLLGKISLRKGSKRILVGQPKTHLSWLLAAIALLIALSFWLERYHLLYSPDGVIFGAGYTDVHARLLAYCAMSVAALGVAVLFVLSVWQKGFTLPAWGIGFSLVVWMLLNGIYPWFQQQFIVAPNELEKEKPYIAYNIEFTRKAYNLDAVQRSDYQVTAQLDRQALSKNQSTIRNIRLWDYRPLLATYRQLQEIRLYYRFKDVDVDRYLLDGDFRQVMLAARELSYSQIPERARTWVNQRLKYTHGYGLVMSPVNRVTPDGLPELYIKDIPPVSQVKLQVSEPAIYYGEETDTYIFTGTRTQEFDYPVGGENAFTQYDGQGGVPMPSLWHRLAYAYDLGSLKILISNYFTDTSRIHYYRLLKERVNQVAPFLRFDNDPYIALINGRLQWIVDAYTASDRYPYSEPVWRSNGAASNLQGGNARQILRGNVNYIRNSVKILVDAYDGTMRFFVVDETDPVLATYRKIFPTLFESGDTIAPEVRAHFRYPLDLFKLQAQMYLSYHMGNSEVFYNREDLWRFPTEVYEGNEQLMQPYYAIMRLPQEKKAEFLLILPFTPANKDNMIAWMAARSDGESYGKLLLYEFPKQELVYGPRQIEARIDQNPQISQQLTLWSQEGSRVIRGDLLVIPIQDSLLYVEPVYLRAEQGSLPQLKRVIVAYENQIAMEKSLENSLEAIFGSPQGSERSDKLSQRESPRGAPGEFSQLVEEALLTYQKAQDALRQGDWASYGQYQQKLGELLQQLNLYDANEYPAK
ncbi:MAG: UPF0182 family protein [Xenococcaceae cyanobacterium]